MSEEEKDKVLQEVAEYLTAGEQIINKYDIGAYSVLTTTERIIALKKFPKNFTGIQYTDISSIEHSTHVLYMELIKGLVLMGFSYYLFTYSQVQDLVTPINSLIENYMPELAGVLPVPLLLKITVVAALLYGIKHVLSFMPSMWGVLKIGYRHHSPLLIRTKHTHQLRALLREVEGKKIESDKDKGKPIIITSGGVPVGAEPEVDTDVDAVLREEFDSVANNSVVLVSTKSKKHMAVVASTLGILVNKKGMGGVYVSVTRPYDYVLEVLDKGDIKSSDIYFIDCISQMAGKAPAQTDKNIVFIENPSSLEEVSMYVDRMLSRVTSEHKFLFIDSLSSLLIYNTPKSVKEFTHFIINKMRLEGIGGVLLSIDKKEANELIETLVPMCDREIRFHGPR